MSSLLIKNGQVVTPDRGVLAGHDVLIEGERITRIAPDVPAHAAELVVEADGRLVLPGFIDMHVHGARLFDFTLGLYRERETDFARSAQIYDEGLTGWSRFLAEHGVTRAYPATFAADMRTLKETLRYFLRYRDGGGNGRSGALLAGVHAEGAFINPEMCGAQDPDTIMEPSVALFDELNEGGAIGMVDVAPETSEDSLALMRHASARGVLVGTGHTNATADQVERAVEHGLRFIAHFLNGPTGSSYKPFDGGGVVEAVLSNEQLYTELILDGYHVSPAYVREVMQRRPQSRIIAVTDASFVTGSPEVREFKVGANVGEVAEGGDYIRLKNSPNYLFGSTLTMDRAFGNLLGWLTTEMEGIWHASLPAMQESKAITLAARVCATNAAELHGLSDTGSLMEGCRADVVVGILDGEAGRYRFEPDLTVVGGRIVHRAPEPEDSR